MTMTVTGMTESVTSVTVAVTITSRCRNTSHGCCRSHDPSRSNNPGNDRHTNNRDRSDGNRMEAQKP